MKTGRLISEGNFRDEKREKPVDTFKNYHEDGWLKTLQTYNDTSLMLQKVYFYANGKRRSMMALEGTSYSNTCWDEAGNETKGCVIEKEARFPGGLTGWRIFLEKNLNANVAADVGAPDGTYPVRVQFRVNKTGKLSDIKVLSVSSHCLACGDEVVRVLQKGPDWEPATINGEPVIYQAIQQVSFMVMTDDSPKKRRRRG